MHDLSGFRCGNTELDSWLYDHARTATGHGTRTYVVLDDGDQVIAYFAIAPHTIDRGGFSKNQSAAQQIPAVLLAKLALAEHLHGQRLGSELLVVALEVILDAARRAGGKFVVVDAFDDGAAAFYAHHEFEAMPTNPRRLTRKLSTIARALDEPWP